MAGSASRTIPGLAPGVVEQVIAVLAAAPGPVRRRKLLEELERRGHRISLAGFNRVLQYCAESGRTIETPEGVRSRPRGD